MASGYSLPERDPLGQVVSSLRESSRRLGEVETQRGTQLYDTISDLRSVVDNLAATIAALSSSGATWYGPVSSGSGNITTTSGDFYTPHGRATPVVVSYVAAYLDSVGRLGATPSTGRLKRDVVEAHWTREQRAAIRVVFYRLRAAYIMADMAGNADDAETLVGVIGEELLAAGFPEFVVLDDKGRVFTVRYELLALIAIDGLQEAERDIEGLRSEVAKIHDVMRQSQTGGKPDADPELQNEPGSA